MKKTLLITILIAALLLFAVGCAKKADQGEAPDQPTTPTPEQPSAPADTAPTEPEPTPVEPAPSQVELLSGIACGDDSLSVTLNNNGDNEWVLSEQKFLLNTLQDKTPECGQETLAPGESTVCKLDSLFFPNKKNVFTYLGNDGTRGNADIMCG